MQTQDPVSAATRRDQMLDGVLEQLRRILAEEGGLPPERIVAERLDVKRHTLRKALQVLRELGYGEDEIRALRAGGALGELPPKG